MASPINGMIVTHFSFGSTLSIHGFSTSPLRTRLEWKYLEGPPPWIADEEPNDDAGLDVKGVENGLLLVLGAGEISSPNGFPLTSGVPSGVPGLIVVVAVETKLPPLCCIPSISNVNAEQEKIY